MVTLDFVARSMENLELLFPVFTAIFAVFVAVFAVVFTESKFRKKAVVSQQHIALEKSVVDPDLDPYDSVIFLTPRILIRHCLYRSGSEG